MFNQCHTRSLVLAWAGEGFGHYFSMSGRQGHRGSSGGDWGEAPRTRRGDIKFILLGLLSERPQHGYELIKALEARQGGFRRLSPGSVYPTLQMLEEGGYLTSEEVDGKRVYTMTESGRHFLSEHTSPSAARHPRDRFSDSQPSELMELRRSLTGVNDAVTQVARSGNLQQAIRVRDLLNQVKREIYKLLAEE